ncbi:Wadjet anti-phage system protein JetD domain-containing protein [Microcella flavibacter]|uniref:Wadjet anti-phage system protein JetD domain-containing protein n=1 Tax=Microcella flavibacter TaxID=1804990 RepID=UPI0014571F29|nr:Wadjet anti-phage system protein JetD domain-containing protein [Microcella flavibacter]
MITVAEARTMARIRLQARWAAWAAGEVESTAPGAPAMAVALHPPTEREVLVDQAGAEQWAREWGALKLLDGIEVEWTTRSWPSAGRQRVPVRLRLIDPDAIAEFVGGEQLRAWRRMRDRARAVRESLGESVAVRAAIRSHATAIAGFDDERFATLLDVATWLVVNTVDGLRPRQLPIRGVDTKWFQAHRSIVVHLHRAATGSDGLGIIEADPLLRVRLLDAAMADNGPSDYAASAASLGELTYRPAGIFVFENLESVLAMPPWVGAIAVHGSGYAVDVVGRIPWVRKAPVVYWGDLDSDGFAILHRLRAHHPRVTSVLMDEATLIEHRDLWVPERRPNRGAFPTLLENEATALARIRSEGDVRLEQERIPWEFALAQLRCAWESVQP